MEKLLVAVIIYDKLGKQFFSESPSKGCPIML